MMKILSATAALVLVCLFLTARNAEAAPCLIVTLTGTQGGPVVFNGLAGAGTLVRYGDDTNNCGAIKLQFDAGRGTSMRLSQIGVFAGQLNATFLTHIHSDHVDGLADLLQLRGCTARRHASSISSAALTSNPSQGSRSAAKT
jgi:ribonuclease Z